MERTHIQLLALAVVVVASTAAAAHALLKKDDPRAALGWVVVSLAYPVFGALAYVVFGVNRIKTKGKRLRERWDFPIASDIGEGESRPARLEHSELYRGAIAEIARVSDRVTRRPLLGGNLVTPLFNGEEAFPEMLAAIENAKESVWLTTYIFDTDGWGKRFVDALAGAADRGLDVRVLVDGVGQMYAWPRVSELLEARGVRVARFLPLSIRNLHFNLRNHRKILVVDRHIGFTGGMNLGDRQLSTHPHPKKRTIDVHFSVKGPAVSHLEEAMYEDWCFASGENVRAPEAARFEAVGDTFCRGISDGPNEDFEAILWILIGAINAARRRVRIITPYFLPDVELETALISASMRGVDVDILLPERSNLRYVDWATRAMLPQMLEYGVQVFLQPAPFPHTKLFLVDDDYAHVGSANLDPRSLRLNFEYNFEAYGAEPATQLHEYFETCRTACKPLLRAQLDGQPLWKRVRNSAFKLLQPYL